MHRTSLLAASLIAGMTLPFAAMAEAPFNFTATPGQLPKTVVPAAYAIDLVTDMTALTLTGHETIDITVSEPAETIVLNQAGLTLNAAALDGQAATVTQDEDAQTATLRLPAPVTPGRHTLTIDYAGPIPQTPDGIYYDDYRDRSGAPKRMLVTQFEVADARRMFPGWDEPAFKATFQLTATLPAGYTAASNMPIASETPVDGGSKRVVFATTPRMSSYLLALVAGDLAALHATGGGTPINAYAPVGEEQKAAGALHAAAEILPYYNDYFGTAYPLPKLDLIAIPGNYAAGAMENWGAITYIDNVMLFDPATSMPRTKETIYAVVAHEMAHQWSGDLVTMGWWDNIWLNEGFATWMQIKATDHFNPSWQIWPRQHRDRELAMGQDAQPTTHAIQQPIRSVSEAGTAFDRISYQKGEQVIRMVEDWLGPDVFRTGMRTYMKAHAYGSATSADLWAALSEASGKDVTPVAASSTEQPGIPLIQMARRCEDGDSLVTLSQTRFTVHDPEAKPQTWQIPVTVGGPGATSQKLVLGAEPVTLRFAGCGLPLKANLGESGYYRTSYDESSLAALASHFGQFDAADRVNLLGDQFALFEAGKAPLSTYLDLSAALGSQNEQSIAVWTDVISHLYRIDALERGVAQRPAFRAFARSLLGPQLARLGWTPRDHESFLDTQLRPSLIAALGRFGDPAVTAEAQRRFAAFREEPSSLPASLLDPVASIVGMHADAVTYDTLVKLAQDAPDTEQKLRWFDALAASPDKASMARSVELLLTGVIPNGRIVAELRAIAVNSDDPDEAWRLMQPKQAALRALLPASVQGRLLPTVAAMSNDPDIRRALLADPASGASPGAKIEAAKAADLIATNAELRGRTQPAITEWLASR